MIFKMISKFIRLEMFEENFKSFILVQPQTAPDIIGLPIGRRFLETVHESSGESTSKTK